MIKLKQVIKYTNANALEATWVDVTEKVIYIPDPNWSRPTKFNEEMLLVEDEAAVQPSVPSVTLEEIPVRCHAYDETQMEMLRADLGADITPEIELLIQEVEKEAKS